MCNTWKKHIDNPELKKSEFKLKDMELLLKNSELKHLKNVSLSGGEPFLRKDIVEIARLIHDYHSHVTFLSPSNCFLTKKVVQKAKEIARFADLTICVSMDGIGDLHDKIRRVPNGFQKLMKTVKELHEAGISLTWSFTIMPENQYELEKVFKFSEPFADSFSCRPMGEGFYFGTKGKHDKLDVEALSGQLKKINDPKNPMNFFIHGVRKFLGGKRMLQCGAGYFSCLITPQFDVFPCTHCPAEWKFGNLKESGYSMEKILDSETAKGVRREFVDKCKSCINEIEYPATYVTQHSKMVLWNLFNRGSNIETEK